MEIMQNSQHQNRTLMIQIGRIMAPRVAPLEGAYTYALRGIRGFRINGTQIYPRASASSAQSVFHSNPSAFISVHPRLFLDKDGR